MYASKYILFTFKTIVKRNQNLTKWFGGTVVTHLPYTATTWVRVLARFSLQGFLPPSEGFEIVLILIEPHKAKDGLTRRYSGDI